MTTSRPTSCRPLSRSAGALLLAGLAAMAPLAAQDYPGVSNKAYGDLADALVDMVRDQAKKLPAGDRNTRDNLYGVLAGFWIAGISGEIILGAAGTAIGGGLGACAAGVGAPPGAAIGFGVGAVVGLPMLMAPAVITIPAVLFIEENYPPPAAGSGGGSYSLRGTTLLTAGPMESLFVSMISALPQEVVVLAQKWDKTPGLPAQARTWLAGHEFLRAPLQRIVYVKEHHRMSPGALVATDLCKAFDGWIDLPSSAEMQDWYLDQLGLLETHMRLTKKGHLELSVPKLLQRAGAPASVDIDVPDLDLKVGGNGGLLDPYVRVTFTPGPADLSWGKASVVRTGERKDQIKLEWSIADNSTIGHLKVTWKAGSDVQTMADLRPKLGKQFSGALFFKPDGLALVPAGFALNNGIDVDLCLPRELKEAADALKDTVGKAVKNAEKELEKLFACQLPWAKVWKQLEKAPGNSLLRCLQESPGMFGLARVDGLLDMEFKNGALRIKVAGQVFVNQKLLVPAADIAKAFKDATGKVGRPRPASAGPHK
jgi:hypothetical protein